MRATSFVASVFDFRPWLHLLRLVHYYNYSHVAPKRLIQLGAGVAIAPNASFRNGERINIGSGSQIGERCSLWAGNVHGRIELGEHVLLGPDVYITASNYEIPAGLPVMHQPTLEQDVTIGANAWLGRGVTVLPGVEIGPGCVVGAGAVVSRSLPAQSIAVGVPAKVVGQRV